MSGVQVSRKSALKKLAATSFAVLGAAGVLYVIAMAGAKPANAAGDLIDLRKGTLAKLEVPGHPRPRDPRLPSRDPGVSPAASPAPDMAFQDAAGKPVKVKDFKGKVVVLNLWATWCAPCKVEMPTLAKLQSAYAAKPLAVIALSADTPDDALAAKAFIAKNKPLKYYASGGSTILFKFKPEVAGLPGTIIYDKKGVERARLPGDADWNSKEVRALVDRLLAEQG